MHEVQDRELHYTWLENERFSRIGQRINSFEQRSEQVTAFSKVP
jgi:hypothetical protein